MITNCDSVEPLGKVKRWSSKEHRKIDVPQPKLFASYNASMGGVDLLDQGVNKYRISIQGKKWWWTIFTHTLNVSVVNAWKLHSLVSENKIDLLMFLRNIIRHYLRCYPKASCSKRPTGTVPRSISQREGGHYPGKLEKQLRCRYCHLRARWSCIKCNVTLCIERDCFVSYHSEV